MEDKYLERFEKLSPDEQTKVTRILEAVGRGEVAQESDYKLSTDARQLIIDIIQDKVLRV